MTNHSLQCYKKCIVTVRDRNDLFPRYKNIFDYSDEKFTSNVALMHR